MSVLVYCLLLILCLDPSNGRHVEVIDTELHDQKYHIPGKGWVQDHLKKGEHRKSISPSSATLLLLEEIEDTQAINNDFSGNENTSSPDQVAAKTEEWKRQPPMTKKKNNDDFVEEVEVTDYAKSHRKPHIHN